LFEKTDRAILRERGDGDDRSDGHHTGFRYCTNALDIFDGVGRFLVCAVYACAAWVSTTSILDLTAAIGCYDSGLLICLLGLYTLDRVRDRRRFV